MMNSTQQQNSKDNNQIPSPQQTASNPDKNSNKKKYKKRNSYIPTKDELLQLERKTSTIKELAEILNMSESKVYYLRKKYGIKKSTTTTYDEAEMGGEMEEDIDMLDDEAATSTSSTVDEDEEYSIDQATGERILTKKASSFHKPLNQVPVEQQMKRRSLNENFDMMQQSVSAQKPPQQQQNMLPSFKDAFSSFDFSPMNRPVGPGLTHGSSSMPGGLNSMTMHSFSSSSLNGIKYQPQKQSLPSFSSIISGNNNYYSQPMGTTNLFQNNYLNNVYPGTMTPNIDIPPIQQPPPQPSQQTQLPGFDALVAATNAQRQKQQQLEQHQHQQLQQNMGYGAVQQKQNSASSLIYNSPQESVQQPILKQESSPSMMATRAAISKQPLQQPHLNNMRNGTSPQQPQPVLPQFNSFIQQQSKFQQNMGYGAQQQKQFHPPQYDVPWG